MADQQIRNQPAGLQDRPTVVSRKQLLEQTWNPEARARLLAQFAEQDRANAEARKWLEEKRKAERKAAEERGRQQRIKMGMPLRGDIPDEDWFALQERRALIERLAAEKIRAGHYADTVSNDYVHAAYLAREAAQAEADQARQAAIDERSTARDDTPAVEPVETSANRKKSA